MKKALILIDIQNDYFPGGAMELIGSQEAGLHAAELLREFRRKSFSVVHIQHFSTRPGSTFFLPDTHGVQINQCVTPINGEPIFRKNFPNSFRDTPLLEHLHQLHIGQLIVAGMMTHMCVDTTIRAAFDLGFQSLLAQDACATVSLSFGNTPVSAEYVQAAFLASMNGLFAKVMTVREIVDTL